MKDRKPIRLDKYLAEAGAGSRSQVKEMIRKGRVSVNKETVRSPEQKVSASDLVEADGKALAYAAYEYWMLNKPAGVVSATEDPKERTVIELIGGAKRRDLFPVGRLDKDTEGLLLVTNDGALAHRLLSPKKHVDKTYLAVLDRLPEEEERRRFCEGLDIGDEKRTLPAGLEVLGPAEKAPYRVRVTIQEGRFHQVKRMFEAVGSRVLYLKRLSMGGLCLDGALRPGECRRLTEQELEILKKKG